jgi:hypothetical protein
MPKAALSLDHMELAQDVASLSRDPLKFAKYSFPWEPRVWQAGILTTIKEHLRDPKKRYTPLRIAVASGHGIGKSALVGMTICWAMSTCEDAKVVLTANTFDQLRTKTWPEVNKWLKESVTYKAGWWKASATSIIFAGATSREWRTDAISWSENNTEAFAGLHNQGKRVVLIFDEASAIADKVWEVAEGALTDEKTEIIWLAFGNPTVNTGRFRECFGRFKHRWTTFQIDSRKVEGTNKEQIEKWIDDYGEDSDFVRVRVRGEFPRAGSSQLIPSDVVAACRKYHADGFAGLPKVLSVDVARFGDDQTVIGTRQGRKVRILGRFRGLDTVQVAERVIALMAEESPDATVVDGDGIGAGVIDHLTHRGYSHRLFEFHGGSKANDSNAYYNRRAEVWGLMGEALKAGMEIPDDAELEQDLTGPEYGFSNKQQIQLEKKEDMKKRGLSSPDSGDMIAMTFAIQVRAPKQPEPMKYVYPGQMQNSWMQ